MISNKKIFSRKNFLTWGITISSVLAVPSIFRAKKKGTKKVKMLTQDGRLVEIDQENIPIKKQKIKSADIHTWVNKRNSSS